MLRARRGGPSLEEAPVHRRLTSGLCVIAVAVLAACGGDSPKSDAAATPAASEEASAAGSPSEEPAAATKKAKPKPSPKTSATASAEPRTSGAASEACVNGWTTPKRGTKLRTFPLDLLRRTQGFKGEFVVQDMRYFKGPDDLGLSAESKHDVVERWYGKVTYTGDASFKLRFLARRTPVGSGIVAIAPFDTTGYEMADWRGFDGEGGSVKVAGLPGRWTGTPTDYASEGGLPPEVAGCLAD
jgi:hypothetical protein